MNNNLISSDNTLLKEISNQRYAWVDTLKFLGIFAIYIGHCGASAGKLYPFVFEYHVPLFFFVSGFFSMKDYNKPFMEYVKKKFRQLMIPYFIFSIISMISFGILENSDISTVGNMFIKYLFGIRNTLRSGSLWFIPCIFMVSIIYFLLNRIFKNKKFIGITIFVIFLSTQFIFQYNPSWFMNIDSAFYYLIYYHLGYISFKFIKNFSYNNLSLNRKLIFVSISILSLLITLLVYFESSSKVVEIMLGHVHWSNIVYILKPFMYFFITLNIIYSNIMLAFQLKDIKLLQTLGSNTLFLCGTESVVSSYIETLILMFGFSLNLTSPLACIFYSFICLIISNYLREKIFSPYFPIILGKTNIIQKSNEK